MSQKLKSLAEKLNLDDSILSSSGILNISNKASTQILGGEEESFSNDTCSNSGCNNSTCTGTDVNDGCHNRTCSTAGGGSNGHCTNDVC